MGKQNHNYRPNHPDVFLGRFTHNVLEAPSLRIINSYIDGKGFPCAGDLVRVMLKSIKIDADIDYYGYKHGRGQVTYEYSIFGKDYAVYCTMLCPITDLMIEMLPDTPATQILFGKGKE